MTRSAVCFCGSRFHAVCTGVPEAPPGGSFDCGSSVAGTVCNGTCSAGGGQITAACKATGNWTVQGTCSQPLAGEEAGCMWVRSKSVSSCCSGACRWVLQYCRLSGSYTVIAWRGMHAVPSDADHDAVCGVLVCLIPSMQCALAVPRILQVASLIVATALLLVPCATALAAPVVGQSQPRARQPATGHCRAHAPSSK